MVKRILVIDDDPLVTRSVKRLLKVKNYEVETAISGHEALEKIEASSFDLIITDIRMPGMNGVETLRKIRQLCERKDETKKAPAVVITGYSEDDASRHAGELGIINFIYKPFEVGEFLSIIKRNLELPPKYKRAFPKGCCGFSC